MTKELITSKLPDTTVPTKIIFSNPLRERYILKEFFKVDESPEDFDCISIRPIRIIDNIICIVLKVASIIYLLQRLSKNK